MSDEFIIVWKDSPGQQIKTVVNASGAPVYRDYEYVKSNDITVIVEGAVLEHFLAEASGEHMAITPDLARSVLGWDV